MHRLFVAIRPPAPIRALLLDVMGGLAGARWQDDAQLHLTLHFLGEVDRHQADDIAAVLAGVRTPRFELRIAGVGSFEHKGRPHAIWVGIAPSPPLHALHAKLARALRSAGVAPDTRAYLPHVTLARLPRTAPPPDPVLARLAGLASPPFDVDAFCLYESILGSEGASYAIAERYPLG